MSIRLTADLSAETLQARREWQDIYKVLMEKNLQPRLLYPARISFRFDREIKTFTDKQKQREFSTHTHSVFTWGPGVLGPSRLILNGHAEPASIALRELGPRILA